MAKSKSERGKELLEKRTAIGLRLVDMVRTGTGDQLEARKQIKEIDEEIIELVQKSNAN